VSRDKIEMGILKTRLSSFFNTFSPTLELVDDLIRKRSHPQEIIILTCSRLDALASIASPEDAPKKEAFVNFICNHGQKRRFFNKVSVGDLYYEFAYHHYLLSEGIFMDGGRLFRSSRDDDAMIEFVDCSAIPLTEERVKNMFTKVMRALSSSFRVKPGQPLAKSHIASIDEVLSCIASSLERSRIKNFSKSTIEAIEPLVKTKVIARLLYERFRSEAIHGGHVQIDNKRFFSRNSPYWTPLGREEYGYSLHLEFPARFLKRLLERCIESYKHHLIAKGVVPVGIYQLVFGEDALKYLGLMDVDSFGKHGMTRLKIPGR
jgi:hypothetical protein